MSQSQSFTCPKCGAPQDYKGGTAATIQCPYCDTTLIVPPELRTAMPDFAAFGANDWANQANALGEIKRLVDGGKKIEAIKRYRETFGGGLKEAKDAVEAIERGHNVQVAQLRIGTPGTAQSFQVTAGGSDIRIATTPEGIQVTPSGGARASAGCMTAIFVLVAVVIIASILLPIALVSTDILGALSPSGSAPTPMPVASSSTTVPEPTTSPTALPIPTPGFAALLDTFGQQGTGPGFLDDARYIAVDNKGNVYVGEYGSARIQRFNAEGKFQDQWLLEPRQPLRGLAADFRGNVYAVQGGVISTFKGETGNLLGKLEYPAGGDGFDAIATTPDGGLVGAWYEGRTGLITAVEGHRDDLVIFDRNGQVKQVIQGAVSNQTGDPELDNKLAVDGAGNIYVLGGTFGEAVFKFSPDGKFITRFGSRGNEPGQFSSPLALATDGKGRVYVSQSNDIMVFAPDGRYLDLFGDIEGAAFGLAFDPEGKLWVVTTNHVYEFALNK